MLLPNAGTITMFCEILLNLQMDNYGHVQDQLYSTFLQTAVL